jgi:caffeoylshikimate esterase
VLQIADDVKPHPLVVAILIKLTNFIPTWKIVPSKDIINNAFKDPLKREQVCKIKISPFWGPKCSP